MAVCDDAANGTGIMSEMSGDTPAELCKLVMELRPDKAPKTVENFLSLVESGFYNGLIFHRVIKGFMIQGGGMTPEFEQKPCKAIRGEFIANGYMQNDLKHKRGTLSMARTSDPDSASSQFFIMHENAPHLDGQYAAFGKVIEGMETVDAFLDVKRVGPEGGTPTEDIRIETMTIL